MNGPNSPGREPLTTLFSGMVLTRPNRPTEDKRESVRFLDIVWAQPYNQKTYYGTLVLHSQGGFRFYSEPFGAISLKVCEYVGRLVKQGKATLDTAPKFPWVVDQSNIT
jgi:hypothetical protein